MDLVFLQILALLRPILFIELNTQILGLSVFEFSAIALFVLLVVAFLYNATLTKNVTLTGVDLFVLAFVSWCVAAYIVYSDSASIKEVARLSIPLLTYTIARNVIADIKDYRRILFLMILGFLPPILLSAGLIVMGKGVEYVSYWTGNPRYSGVYAGAHSLSHNAAFVLMAMGVYLGVRSDGQRRAWNWETTLFAVLASLALYCIYASRVRTTILGLMVFVGVYLFLSNKKAFAMLVAVVLVSGLAFSQKMTNYLFYEADLIETGKWDISRIGSDRPRIWLNNLSYYAGLPLDRKIAGVGIGNKIDLLGPGESGTSGIESVRDSHNDYLDVFMQTGFVGLVLFAAVQLLIFQAVRRLPKPERHVFLALFLAITAMNLVSNSYVTRFGLAQMFYLAIAYVGVLRPQARETAKLHSRTTRRRPEPARRWRAVP